MNDAFRRIDSSALTCEQKLSRILQLLLPGCTVAAAVMGSKVQKEKDWTASRKCTVVLLEGVAYVRYHKSQEETTLPTERVTLEEGDRIVSLEGCTIEVEDVD